jgi:hypothetical protein
MEKFIHQQNLALFEKRLAEPHSIKQPPLCLEYAFRHAL